jgi:hypothetical protein
MRAESRFMRALPKIEKEWCLCPVRPLVWTTAEEMDRDPNKRWRDAGNGVFWLVSDHRERDDACGEAD